MSNDLVRMVNQIATFFEPYPEEEAIQETKNHIQSFWTPQMRAELHAYAKNGGAGLGKISLAAAQRILNN